MSSRRSSKINTGKSSNKKKDETGTGTGSPEEAYHLIRSSRIVTNVTDDDSSSSISARVGGAVEASEKFSTSSSSKDPGNTGTGSRVDPSTIVVAPDMAPRKRTKTSRVSFEVVDPREERLLQQAIKNSIIDNHKQDFIPPSAPVYRPSVEEFADPIAYIESIRAEAAQYGMCQIVPPDAWKPTCHINMDSPVMFSTKQQHIQSLQEGVEFEDGGSYNIRSYKKAAEEGYVRWVEEHYEGRPPTLDNLCKDYWDTVETARYEIEVDYANDLDTTVVGSGFPPKQQSEHSATPPMTSEEYYHTTGWNLNNIASTDQSLLKLVSSPINGINVPWLYLGMLFTTFCWHTEDNYLYSINYLHFGKEKQWYSIPGSHARQFEKASKDFLLESFKVSPDLLHHLTTQISPALVHANGIPVYAAVQTPGTFLVTFPQAYHCGFNYGFNCAEAVNFGTMDWLPFGIMAEERYRLFGRPAVFSFIRLLFTLLETTTQVSARHFEMLHIARRVLEEELMVRPHAFSLGVRSIAHLVKLLPNTFIAMDKAQLDYDDKRMCCVCKSICIFSAVACDCSQSKVACLRHEQFMCKCSRSKKFVLEWASVEELRTLIAKIDSMLG